MKSLFAATPFKAAFNPAHALRLHQLEKVRGDITNDAGSNYNAPVDKWKILNALTLTRAFYGVSDRTLTVLSGLLSVLPARELCLSETQIVFPSNESLSQRCHGITGSTLRRHLAKLVELGLILRRDSPNGKRYANRNAMGEIENAYGFDLGPLALRAHEFFAQEEAFKNEERLKTTLRNEISVHLRDMASLISTVLSEAPQSDMWEDFFKQLAPLGKRLPRTMGLKELTVRRDELQNLRLKVDAAWLNGFSNETLDEEMEINAVQNGRQLENTNKNKYLEEALKNEVPDLELVVQICPEINLYAKEGIRSWSDFMKTACFVSVMLGISFDAFEEAKTVFGEREASVIIAILLQKGENIAIPGAYLRGIMKKARDGRFSLSGMLRGMQKNYRN